MGILFTLTSCELMFFDKSQSSDYEQEENITNNNEKLPHDNETVNQNALVDIKVSEDGYLVINGTKTEYKIDTDTSEDIHTGLTEISEDGYLVINGIKTEYKIATDTIFEISEDAYLIVNGIKTEYKIAKDDIVEVSEDGYLIVNSIKTEYKIISPISDAELKYYNDLAL